VVAAGGAVDPLAGAFDVVFFFPDRHAGLGFVDDIATGVERGAAMRGGDTGPDGEIADLQRADAVDAVGGDEVEFGAGFFEDAVALAFGECGEGFVVERADGAAVVVVAHPAFEGDAGAGVGIEQELLQRGGVERRSGKAERHPPSLVRRADLSRHLVDFKGISGWAVSVLGCR